MSTQAKQSYFTPEEYLELERNSLHKHEYQRGLVYAMSGAKKNHVLITTNLSGLLGHHLENSPCMVSIANMKVRIEAVDCYYYPDISVTCDKKDLETNNDFILVPKLIIEVLSKSTERFDRTGKFIDYQHIPELQEYVLVSQDQIQVECFRKQASGEWQSQCYQLGDIVEITSMDFKCSIEKIYHKVLGLINA
jgi:Uma2 family endonuclease